MKAQLTICALLVLLTGVLAYELDDNYYNDIFHSSSLHQRYRRAAEEGPHSHGMCCDVVGFGQMPLDYSELHKICMSEAFQGNVPKRGDISPKDHDKWVEFMKKMDCAFQCMTQKRNVADSAGKIIEEAAKQTTSTIEKDSWLFPMKDEMLAKCLAEAKKAHDPQPGGCSRASSVLFNCWFKEVQLACPKDQIKDQESCDKLRGFLSKPPPMN